MFRPRQALPLDRRTEAWVLLHDELIAAVARRPLATTRAYIDAWLGAVADIASRRGPVVFDWFVVGRPAPQLLEIAHELRAVRRGEARGDFDDEEEEWYERRGDDADPWQPPTTPERVVAALDGRPAFGPLATRLDVQSLIGRRLGVGHDDVFDIIEIGLCVDLLMAEVADVVRIGDLALADGRLPGERRYGFDLVA